MTSAAQTRFTEWLTETYSIDPDAMTGLVALARESVALEISGTAVRSEEQALQIHIADSLAGLRVPAIKSAENLIDIGTGVGFPGLVLAIVKPSLRVTLIDSVGKKIEAAAELARELGLSNVEAIWARFEDHSAVGSEARQSFDVVTARAVAPLNVLLEYALPFLKPSGSLVAWKGSPSTEELANADAAAQELGFTAEPLIPTKPFPKSEQRHFYVAKRSAELGERYPRRPGVALRKPITAPN